MLSFSLFPIMLIVFSFYKIVMFYNNNNFFISGHLNRIVLYYS